MFRGIGKVLLIAASIFGAAVIQQILFGQATKPPVAEKREDIRVICTRRYRDLDHVPEIPFMEWMNNCAIQENLKAKER